MCGIAGFSSFNENFKKNSSIIKKNKNIIINMTDVISRRGPDGYGSFLNENAILGHRRLSIIDLESGAQPITSSCGKYTIVYNGEIYNTESLRDELKKLGGEFSTDSDTEVVLNAYKYFGEEAPKKLNGIFAFAIWDDVKKQVFLCRDHFGVKPLFYTLVNDTIIFGSEIKVLGANPLVDLEITGDSLKEVLGLFPSRTEGNGVFKNIYEIRYGHFGVFNEKGFREEKYWDLNSEEFTLTYEETVKKVRELVLDSIKKQMVSDVPISTFLSGGLDSSIITGVISNELEKEKKTLNTYSFDYEENSLYFKSNSFQVDEDKKWVDKMVNEFDLEHKYLECNIETLKDYLYNVVDSKDLPGMADIESSLMYFCEEVSKEHKVVLSGECADEIFGGYPWFHREDAFNTNNFPWIRNIDFREDMLLDEVKEKLNIKEYIQEAYYKSIDEVPVFDGDNLEEKRRREISYLNIKWFMTTLLERMDRMSMYSGLESRVPYADFRIVEFMWNVPWEYKNTGMEKGLLRDAFKGILPDEILYRKKVPYPKTYNPKYENLLAIELKKILKNKKAPLKTLIKEDELLKLIQSPKDYGRPWFGQLMAGPQLMAYYIQLNYWLEKNNFDIDKI